MWIRLSQHGIPNRMLQFKWSNFHRTLKRKTRVSVETGGHGYVSFGR